MSQPDPTLQASTVEEIDVLEQVCELLATNDLQATIRYVGNGKPWFVRIDFMRTHLMDNSVPFLSVLHHQERLMLILQTPSTMGMQPVTLASFAFADRNPDTLDLLLGAVKAIVTEVQVDALTMMQATALEADKK